MLLFVIYSLHLTTNITLYAQKDAQKIVVWSKSIIIWVFFFSDKIKNINLHISNSGILKKERQELDSQERHKVWQTDILLNFYWHGCILHTQWLLIQCSINGRMFCVLEVTMCFHSTINSLISKDEEQLESSWLDPFEHQYNSSSLYFRWESRPTHYTCLIREAQTIYHNEGYSAGRIRFVLEGHCGPDE